MACKKYNIKELQEIRKEWADIPVEAVPKTERDIFMNRKIAVDMYIDGKKMSDIYEATGIKHNNLPRLLKRCLLPNGLGGYIGYKALLPNTKIRTEDTVLAGKFAKLLLKYPDLIDFIKGCWYGDKKYTLEKNMNFKSLHERFKSKCANLGISKSEYPFNTAREGYVSLCKYVKDLDRRNIRQAATRESKDDMQKLNSTGIGNRYTKDPIAPYSVVQIDGHIIDLMYNVETMGKDGTISRRAATRAWLIAVVDVATRCVLGYSVSQEFNYNQYDVIDALQDALLPKEYPKITIDGLHYPENSGYPSTAFPELQYAMFDTVMLDNAKSHLAINTMDKIVDQLRCSVNYGSVATPVARGIVERFFGTLETRGFHRLPATTGSNTRDLKRRDPEKVAVALDITFDHIVQLLDVLIAEYNNTPHSSLENLTPLECMRRRVIDRGMFPTIANDEMKEVIHKLDYRVDTRVVRGGTNGKRAYIHYMGVDYRSNALSATGLYLGQTITIFVNPRDISEVEAYAENGAYIGVLRAKGEYGTKSHSLKTRLNARRLANERGRAHLEFDTPITAYENLLAENAKKSRRDATKADIVRREQGKASPSEMAKEKENNPTPVVSINSNSTFSTDITDPDEFIEKVWGLK